MGAQNSVPPAAVQKQQSHAARISWNTSLELINFFFELLIGFFLY